MRLLCEDVVGNTPGSATTVCRNNNINNNNNNSNSPWNSKICIEENQITNGNFAGQNRYYQSGNSSNNSNGHHQQQQMSGSAAAASSLLANFLLLNPLNPDAKKIYFSMLPKIASESLVNGSITIEDYKKVLNCFANNPQLNWEERRIIEGLANEIDDSRRLVCENKSRSNNGSWRAGSCSPLSPLLNGKARRAMSLTGVEDVFSRMKTFKCDADDPSSTATQAQKSSFTELNSGMKDVPSWLKSLRLHKYSPLFAQMTYDEMLKLTEEMLESKGVTVGARRKIILSIQKLKDRVTVLKQLEKDLIDVSRVPATLSELRTIIGTPIKPQRVDQAEEENIPVFFAQTLVKACSYLLSSPINSNGTLDDDCFSAAVHIIDKCLSHEAFMPPQKKRLASLKQEIRRLWSPRHYRKFSLQNNFQNSLMHQNCAAVANKDRRMSCDPAGIPHGNPCCSQAVPNALFLSSLAQHLSPSTSNDAVAPLINLFCQHMNLQNNRQNVQRRSSAPLWGAGNIFSPSPQPQSLINGPQGMSHQQNFAQAQQLRMPQSCHSPTPSIHRQSNKSKFPNICNPPTTATSTPPQSGLFNTNLTINSGASMAGKTAPLPLDQAAGLYSPWSFYSGLQRSAWSCGVDDGISNNSANSFFNQCSFSSKQPSTGSSSNNGTNGVAASGASCNTFLSTLVGGPFLNAAAAAAAVATGHHHHHHPIGAVNIPSSAGSANSGNQNNLVGSFGEYSGIDQLCRSMIEAIDCYGPNNYKFVDSIINSTIGLVYLENSDINENLSISMVFLLLFTRNPVFLVVQQQVLRLLILSLILFFRISKSSAMETVQKEKFVEKSADFGLKIFEKIVDQKGQKDGAPCSTFMSPTSINVALAMLYAGADKSTKQEMNKWIFGQMDDNVIESNVQYLSKMLNKTNDDKSGYTLTVANGMFVQENYAILPTYVKMLKDYYATQAESVDFSTKQAESKINQWTAQKTNQKITKLFENLDSDTRLVLANAIYFKGDWHTKFDAASTVDMPFHVTEQKIKQLPFMRARNKLFHFNDQDQDWSILGMPYKSQQLMMTVFLPKEQHRFQLNMLQKQLTGAKLWKLIDDLKLHDKMDLDVQMPKFKFDSEANLVGCLQSMGVRSMFTQGQANLMKISSANDLFVSAIVHKAVIEVNEEGSEAAAVTGVAVSTRSMPMYDRFMADHPFMFAIVDKTSRSLLFLGQYYG